MTVSEAFNKPEPKRLPVSVNIITTPNDMQKAHRLFASIPEGVEVVIVLNEQGEEPDEKVEHKAGERWDTRVIKRTYTGDFNFADARNCAKHYSTRDWILWLDSDDEIVGTNIGTLLSELADLPIGIGGLFAGCVGLQKSFGKNPTAYYAVAQVRLFRNLPQIAWSGKAHEQIAESINQNYLSLEWTDLLIQHHGYNVNEQEMMSKLRRNVKMMCTEYGEGDLKEYRLNGLEDLILRDISSIKAMTNISQ